MSKKNNCITLTNIYKENGDSFEKVMKNLINSGHLIINDVEYNQQIVIKTERDGGK